MSLLLPPSTIGIVGGGQLGAMMAMSAKKRGYRVIVLDPTENCPAAQVSDEQIIAAYSDTKGFEQLAQKSDVITYEFENVNSACIEKYEKSYRIPQGSTCLKVSQHRFIEKNFAKELQIPCIPYALVQSKEDLYKAVEEIGYPCILKTCQNGYDGKGQVKLDSEKELLQCIELCKQECVLEGFINFDYEISVVLTRSAQSTVIFPIPQNIHSKGILRYSVVNDQISTDIRIKAEQIANKLADAMNYCGTFAVELFVLGNQVYFNEMACRPHNSAHYTIEGCNFSQFDTHILAICGLPLPKIRLLQPTVMANILGQDLESLNKYLKLPYQVDYCSHLYGKAEAKKDRKMGHITFFDQDLNRCLTEAKRCLGDEK